MQPQQVPRNSNARPMYVPQVQTPIYLNSHNVANQPIYYGRPQYPMQYQSQSPALTLASIITTSQEHQKCIQFLRKQGFSSFITHEKRAQMMNNIKNALTRKYQQQPSELQRRLCIVEQCSAFIANVDSIPVSYSQSQMYPQPMISHQMPSHMHMSHTQSTVESNEQEIDLQNDVLFQDINILPNEAKQLPLNHNPHMLKEKEELEQEKHKMEQLQVLQQMTNASQPSSLVYLPSILQPNTQSSNFSWNIANAPSSNNPNINMSLNMQMNMNLKMSSFQAAEESIRHIQNSKSLTPITTQFGEYTTAVAINDSPTNFNDFEGAPNPTIIQPNIIEDLLFVGEKDTINDFDINTNDSWMDDESQIEQKVVIKVKDDPIKKEDFIGWIADGIKNAEPTVDEISWAILNNQFHSVVNRGKSTLKELKAPSLMKSSLNDVTLLELIQVPSPQKTKRAKPIPQELDAIVTQMLEKGSETDDDDEQHNDIIEKKDDIIDNIATQYQNLFEQKCTNDNDKDNDEDEDEEWEEFKFAPAVDTKATVPALDIMSLYSTVSISTQSNDKQLTFDIFNDMNDNIVDDDDTDGDIINVSKLMTTNEVKDDWPDFNESEFVGAVDDKQTETKKKKKVKMYNVREEPDVEQNVISDPSILSSVDKTDDVDFGEFEFAGFDDEITPKSKTPKKIAKKSMITDPSPSDNKWVPDLSPDKKKDTFSGFSSTCSPSISTYASTPNTTTKTTPESKQRNTKFHDIFEHLDIISVPPSSASILPQVFASTDTTISPSTDDNIPKKSTEDKPPISPHSQSQGFTGFVSDSGSNTHKSVKMEASKTIEVNDEFDDTWDINFTDFKSATDVTDKITNMDDDDISKTQSRSVLFPLEETEESKNRSSKIVDISRDESFSLTNRVTSSDCLSPPDLRNISELSDDGYVDDKFRLEMEEVNEKEYKEDEQNKNIIEDDVNDDEEEENNNPFGKPMGIEDELSIDDDPFAVDIDTDEGVQEIPTDNKKADTNETEEKKIYTAVHFEYYEQAVLLFEKLQIQCKIILGKKELKLMQTKVAMMNDVSDDEDDDDGNDEIPGQILQQMMSLRKVLKLQKSKLKKIETKLMQLDLNSMDIYTYNELFDKCQSLNKLKEFLHLFPKKFTSYLPTNEYIIDDELIGKIHHVIKCQKRAHFFVDCISDETNMNVNFNLYLNFLKFCFKQFEKANETLNGILVQLKVSNDTLLMSYLNIVSKKNTSTKKINIKQKCEKLMEYLFCVLIMYEYCAQIGNGLQMICNIFQENETIVKCDTIWKKSCVLFNDCIVKQRIELKQYLMNEFQEHPQFNDIRWDVMSNQRVHMLPDKQTISQFFLYINQINISK